MSDTNFDYKVRDDDITISYIRDIEDFYSYDYVNPTSISMEYIKLRDEINNNDDIFNNYELLNGDCDIEYIKSSKKIWNELGIKLQKVQCLSPQSNYTNDDFEYELPKDLKKFLKDDYPTELPIEIVDNNLKIGINEFLISLKNYNTIIFKGICLPMLEKKTNSSVYAHEITHIELENAGGGIKKITNTETLPMFIEFLFANKIDESGFLVNNVINHRLGYVSAVLDKLLNDKSISFKSRINKEKYLMSIIQAINLYNIYKDGNDKIKYELIQFVNNIFEGETVVEEMLDKFDSNFIDIEPKLKLLKR